MRKAMKEKNVIKQQLRKLFLLFLCLVFPIAISACGLKGDQTGGAGNDELRIVATSVSVCEIMDRLDLDLVGVPESSFKLPERYSEITTVGLPMSPDMELLRYLNPTVVISPNSLQYDLKPQYENIQVASIFVNLMSVEGMLKSIEQMGIQFDRKNHAAAIIAEHEEYMTEYNKKIEGKRKPRVLVLMGLPGSYMVATDRSYVGNLVKLAGGENVFDGDQAFLNLNTEAIIKTNPDIILRAAHGIPDEVKESFEKEFRRNDIWKHFRAVQNNRVFDLDYNIFNMSANLAYQEALTTLYEMLYDTLYDT